MKKIIILFLIGVLLNSCLPTKQPRCYLFGKSKIVAYKVEVEDCVFCKEHTYKFHGIEKTMFETNIIFEAKSKEPPICVICDASFIGVQMESELPSEKPKNEINIQIGKTNKIEK